MKTRASEATVSGSSGISSPKSQNPSYFQLTSPYFYKVCFCKDMLSVTREQSLYSCGSVPKALMTSVMNPGLQSIELSQFLMEEGSGSAKIVLQ